MIKVDIGLRKIFQVHTSGTLRHWNYELIGRSTVRQAQNEAILDHLVSSPLVLDYPSFPKTSPSCT